MEVENNMIGSNALAGRIVKKTFYRVEGKLDNVINLLLNLYRNENTEEFIKGDVYKSRLRKILGGKNLEILITAIENTRIRKLIKEYKTKKLLDELSLAVLDPQSEVRKVISDKNLYRLKIFQKNLGLTITIIISGFPIIFLIFLGIIFILEIILRKLFFVLTLIFKNKKIIYQAKDF